jgi:starvation-inducible DNA-binding protein
MNCPLRTRYNSSWSVIKEVAAMGILRIIACLSVILFGFSTFYGSVAAQDLSIYKNQTATERIPLNPSQRDPAAQTLQNTLVEIIDLTLSTKQAHWNVSGPLFYSLHGLFDEFVEDYRTHSDRVAERMLAIGRPADGRPQIVSTTADLPTFPEGQVSDYKVLDILSQRLETVGERLRDRITRLDNTDAVTQDILIDVERDIAEHLWMLREFQQ